MSLQNSAQTYSQAEQLTECERETPKRFSLLYSFLMAPGFVGTQGRLSHFSILLMVVAFCIAAMTQGGGWALTGLIAVLGVRQFTIKLNSKEDVD